MSILTERVNLSGPNIKDLRSDTRNPRPHIALTKTGAIIFNYGDGNKFEWPMVLSVVKTELDSIQSDELSINPFGNITPCLS